MPRVASSAIRAIDYDAVSRTLFVTFEDADRYAYTDVPLEQIGALGGDGGLIAVSRSGEIAMPYNSQGMKRAALYPDGRITSAAFED